MPEEYTDGLDSEEDETEDDDQTPPPAEGETVPREQYEKVVKAERSLRTRLRRTEMEAEFGKDVVELVPLTLPLKEQKTLAAKLKERLGSQTATTPAEQGADATTEASEERPTEEERRAAALVSQGSGGAVAGVITDDAEAAKLDEATYARLRDAGLIQLEKLPKQGPLV